MRVKRYRGTVTRGAGRATRLGFPTINVPLSDASVSGVYAAEAEIGGKRYRAAAFADPLRGILEAHLLDFEGDLYGTEAVIELSTKLRDGMRFENDAELSRAIAEDARRIREYFDRRSSSGV